LVYADLKINDEGFKSTLDGWADIRIIGNPSQNPTVYWQLLNLIIDSSVDKEKLTLALHK